MKTGKIHVNYSSLKQFPTNHANNKITFSKYKITNKKKIYADTRLIWERLPEEQGYKLANEGKFSNFC